MSSTGSSSKPAPPQTTLYVGNLTPRVTEAMLLEKFSAAGAVSSVKVCRSRTTQQFSGWGFVEFRRTEDAARALESMNSTSMCGRPVRVMWAKDSSPPPEVALGVLVKGLNSSIDSKALYGTFSSFGTIREFAVFRSGCGFVQFDSEKEVNNCIAKTDGWKLAGISVVKLFTNVQVRNFGNRLNGSTLRDMFGQYGSIYEYRVVSNGGSSNGYAYVTFNKLESAAQALVALDGKDFGDGVLISVVSTPQPKHPLEEMNVDTRNKDKPAKDKQVKKANSGEVDPKANLYIVVKDGMLSNERLRTLFSPFGTIRSVRVLLRKGPKRAGFVCFSSKEEGTRALNEMNGKLVGDAPISVTYAIAEKTKKPEQPVVLTPTDQTEANPISNEKLYLKVKALNASMAGMVTAKLLQLDILPQLMTQPGALKSKVDDIVVTLLLNCEQHLQQIVSAPAGSAAA